MYHTTRHPYDTGHPPSAAHRIRRDAAAFQSPKTHGILPQLYLLLPAGLYILTISRRTQDDA